MSLRTKLRYWLFPSLKEAENKSGRVIDELDALVQEVRLEREEVVRRNNHPERKTHELDTAH